MYSKFYQFRRPRSLCAVFRLREFKKSDLLFTRSALHLVHQGGTRTAAAKLFNHSRTVWSFWLTVWLQTNYLPFCQHSIIATADTVDDHQGFKSLESGRSPKQEASRSGSAEILRIAHELSYVTKR